MAYSNFSLSGVVQQFALTVQDNQPLVTPVLLIAPGTLLRATLDEHLPLATAIGTEKARSELLIMPVLVEVRRLAERQISLFSGIEFSVDPAQGLTGVCDFILSRSREQHILRAPVIIIVEAKKDDINAGLGQCVAELLAAQLFNERETGSREPVFGVVSTGTVWKFLRLDAGMLTIDPREYYIDQIDQILGVFCVMLQPHSTATVLYERASQYLLHEQARNLEQLHLLGALGTPQFVTLCPLITAHATEAQLAAALSPAIPRHVRRVMIDTARQLVQDGQSDKLLAWIATTPRVHSETANRARELCHH